ncbi:MAG TPA: cytoplasmic protein [Methylococcus sp.]|nr:cytoplasmic protein [Methylococcus sp.]
MAKPIDQSEREVARWITLDALYHGSGYPVSERLIHSVLEAVPVRSSAADVRAHFAYLESAGLATVRRLADGTQTATITRAGVDVVEYNSDCPPGIARPVKYW